jgi:DNA mismatch endonuclease, patch repair protein
MDRLTKKRRSEIMSRIRSKNTKPEMIVRSLIHRLGYRYRLHYEKLPGKPDLAFASRKKVIFVNGCFWHGHEKCPKGKLPKSNLDFWEPKIAKNKKRDEVKKNKIEDLGWRVLTIWQCEIKNLENIENKILNFLNS